VAERIASPEGSKVYGVLSLAVQVFADVETVMAKKPSIILSLPVDPATAASVYDPARQAGVKLGFVDNCPAGYKQGVLPGMEGAPATDAAPKWRTPPAKRSPARG